MGFTRQVRQLLIGLLLVPVASFGAITVTSRGTGGNNTSENATTVTPGSNMAAGSTAVLNFAGDNANGATGNIPSTITDSVGNKWLITDHLSTAGANNNVEMAAYVGYLTTALTTSDSITITYTNANVVAKAWTLTELVPSTAGDVIVVSTFGHVATSATGTPTVTTSVTIASGDVVVGYGSAESADTWTGDSDTTNGSWSTQQSTGFGSGATGMSVISQAKVVNATGAQTYNPTLTSADTSVGWLNLTEGTPATRGASSVNAGSASMTLTVAVPLAVNSLGVWCIAADNAGTNGASSNMPSSFSDSQSNTWTLRENGIFDNGVASAGVELATYTSVLGTALAVGDTLTATFTTANVVAKGSALLEFSDATAYNTGGVGTGATTGTPSVTTGSITNGHYVVGVAGVESADTWTADSDSSNGTWSSAQKFSSSSGGGGMSGIFQYKKVTGTGTQTFNPTCTSADTMIQWTDLTAPAPSTNTTNGFFNW